MHNQNEPNKDKNEKKNGNASDKQEAKAEKKTWWQGLDPDLQAVIVIGGSITGFFVALIGAATVANAFEESSRRKTLESPAMREMISRGHLDPIPPPKTIEEAAARALLERGNSLMLPAGSGPVVVERL